EGADGIAFPRLDLHDVRAEVGEGHGRVGPRDVAREVHHAQAGEGAFARGRAHRSRTIAKPRPPAAQTEMRPRCALLRFISLARLVVRRAPVAPNGWPIAMDPPFTFRRERSIFPTASVCPSFSLAQVSDSRAWMFEATCDAKASCISMTSMSARVTPARCRALGTARAGPIRSCPPGSTAATAQDLMKASGSYPSARARASDIRRTAAAPSVSGDEFPAVTVPYLRSNTGGSAASASRDVSRRSRLS